MRLRLMLLVCVVAVLVTAVLGPRQATSAGRACHWRVFPLPAYRDATHHPGVNGLAVASARAVWAPGWWTNPLDGREHPVTFQWNGRSWQLVPSPEFGAIAAVGRVAWLVGKHQNRAFSARWTRRRWRVVPTPGGKSSYLVSAAIVSARDVWAVGQGASGPLLLRWKGRAWIRTAGPDFGGSDGYYESVARIPGTSSVWIFGLNSGTGAELAAQWSGTTWVTYTLPMSGTGSALSNRSLTVGSAASAWIGTSVQQGNGQYQPWLLHWNGSSWSQVPAPNPGGNGQISGVSAGSPSDAWAIGSSIITKKKVKPFLLHWDGARWSTVGLPAHAGYPSSVAAVPGTRQVWVGGGTLDRYSC